MKKRFSLIIVIFMIAALLSSGSAVFATLPDVIVRENVAQGKDVEFRSFDDFTVAEVMYDYWVDQSGIDGTGCQPLTGNHMTDGIVGWDNSTFLNAVMGISAAEINSLPNVGHMAWAYIDLETSYIIDEVGIYAVDSWFLNKPVIQVSENGTDWETVFSGALTLYNSEGDAIYEDGYVNLEKNKAYLCA